MKISIATLNFNKADVSLRAGFQFRTEELDEIYISLKNKPGLNGLVILSTCNRTEIYLDHSSIITVYDILRVLQKYKRTNIDIDRFEFIQDNQKSICYMMEVANGLHSMAYGDKQVFGQMKEAYTGSKRQQAVSGTMERIFQVIFRTHKRIVNETAYHQGSQSVSHLAVSAIKKKYQDHNTPVLVIGAGEIAADLLKYLSSMNFSKVTVVNRTDARAVLLASKYQYDFAEYDLKVNFLKDFSVIISCACAGDLIDTESLGVYENMLLIDLTTFQSFKSSDSVKGMITLDHLKKLRQANTKAQRDAIGMVRSIIAQESLAFFKWTEARLIFI